MAPELDAFLPLSPKAIWIPSQAISRWTTP